MHFICSIYIGIPVVLVLTKVDILCEEVGKDVTKMFRSKKILEVIKTASEMFEMEEDSIHPVVSYVNDLEMRTEINIPILLALRQSLHLASIYLEYLRIESDDDVDASKGNKTDSIPHIFQKTI
jgi:GTPase